jgi:hypothetical protein
MFLSFEAGFHAGLPEGHIESAEGVKGQFPPTEAAHL